MKDKSWLDRISLKSYTFLIKNETKLVPDIRNNLILQICEIYQEDCRIYLDEYPEQEKLRNLYFMDNMGFPFKLPNIEDDNER
jgi:hypothetical protein